MLDNYGIDVQGISMMLDVSFNFISFMNVTQNLPNKIFRNIIQCTDLVFSEYTCPVIPRTQALPEGRG